mmetsp:Transcript_4167/g.14954  ORF Transcript_4167/g.14954 Transcript_4167/m.14954 type:complete len:1259 (+) Transcript_4167:317-4093(+)|eukprot:scaffold993_cov393-Prasinococcus_capsulatus_cf.AAC.18
MSNSTPSVDAQLKNIENDPAVAQALQALGEARIALDHANRMDGQTARQRTEKDAAVAEAQEAYDSKRRDLMNLCFKPLRPSQGSRATNHQASGKERAGATQGHAPKSSPFNYAQSIGTSVRELPHSLHDLTDQGEREALASFSDSEEDDYDENDDDDISFDEYELEEHLADLAFARDAILEGTYPPEFVETLNDQDALDYPGFASVQANFETCVQQWVRKLLITVTKYFIGNHKAPKDVVPSLLPALQNLFGNLPGWREELEDLSRSDVYTIAELQKSVDSTIQRLERGNSDRLPTAEEEGTSTNNVSKSHGSAGSGKGKKKKKKGGKGGSGSNNGGGSSSTQEALPQESQSVVGTGLDPSADDFHEPDDAEIYFYSILLVHFVRQSRTSPVNEDTERKIVRALLELEADALVPNAEPEEFDPMLDPIGSEYDDDGSSFPPAPKLKLNSFCAACVGELPHLLEELLASPYFIPEHLEEIDPTPGPGWTPLMYAAFVQSTSCMKILLRAGADVDAEDSDGRTALFHAITKSRGPQAIQALLDAGSDIEHTDHVGLTPVAYAEELGLQDAVEYLQPLLEKAQQRSRLKERLEKRMRHRRIRAKPVQPARVDAEAEARALAAEAELLQELEAEEQAKQEKAKKAGKKKKSRGKKGDADNQAGDQGGTTSPQDKAYESKLAKEQSSPCANDIDNRESGIVKGGDEAPSESGTHRSEASPVECRKLVADEDKQRGADASARGELEEVVQYVLSKLAVCDARVSGGGDATEASENDSQVISELQEASQKLQVAIETAAEEGISVKYARKVLKKVSLRIENGGKVTPGSQSKIQSERIASDDFAAQLDGGSPPEHSGGHVQRVEVSSVPLSDTAAPLSGVDRLSQQMSATGLSINAESPLPYTHLPVPMQQMLPTQPSLLAQPNANDAEHLAYAPAPSVHDIPSRATSSTRRAPGAGPRKTDHASSYGHPPRGPIEAVAGGTIGESRSSHKPSLPPGIPLGRLPQGVPRDGLSMFELELDGTGQSVSVPSLGREQQNPVGRVPFPGQSGLEQAKMLHGSTVGRGSPFGPTLLGVNNIPVAAPGQQQSRQRSDIPSPSPRMRPPPGMPHPDMELSGLGQLGVPAQSAPALESTQTMSMLPPGSAAMTQRGLPGNQIPQAGMTVGQGSAQRMAPSLGSIFGPGPAVSSTRSGSHSSPWDYGIGLPSGSSTFSSIPGQPFSSMPGLQQIGAQNSHPMAPGGNRGPGHRQQQRQGQSMPWMDAWRDGTN